MSANRLIRENWEKGQTLEKRQLSDILNAIKQGRVPFIEDCDAPTVKKFKERIHATYLDAINEKMI